MRKEIYKTEEIKISKESLEKAFEIRGLNFHQEDDYKIIISHK